MKLNRLVLVGLLLPALGLAACSNAKSSAHSDNKAPQGAQVHQVAKVSSQQSKNFSDKQIEKELSSLGYQARTVEQDYLANNKGNMIYKENPESVTLFFQYAESSEDTQHPDMILDVIKQRNTAEVDLIKVNKNLQDSDSNWLKGYAGVPGLLKKAKPGQWIVEVENGDDTPFLLTNLQQLKTTLAKL